jgi:hypothetical protein
MLQARPNASTCPLIDWGELHSAAGVLSCCTVGNP